MENKNVPVTAISEEMVITAENVSRTDWKVEIQDWATGTFGWKTRFSLN